jgi:hypothetical protein
MKLRRILILPGVIIVLAVFGFASFKTAFAQKSSNVGMIVHPSNFDLAESPGKTITDTITLDNLQSQPIKVKVVLRNFVAQGEEGSVSLTTDDTTYSLAKWIKVDPMTVEIKPHESSIFNFSITVPENAEPGGHFGSIVFTTIPPEIKGTGAVLSTEVASLVLLKIPGDTKEQAVLESFTTNKSFYEFGPVLFDVKVKNEGGVHIVPAGSIIVKGWLGQKFFVPLEMRNVLPDATRKIPATLKNKLLFGKFTATLIATYGTKGQQLYSSTQFSAFPIRYAIIGFTILIILLLGIMLVLGITYFATFKKNRIKKAISVLFGKN